MWKSVSPSFVVGLTQLPVLLVVSRKAICLREAGFPPTSYETMSSVWSPEFPSFTEVDMESWQEIMCTKTIKIVKHKGPF